jgi:hypothetical protein
MSDKGARLPVQQPPVPSVMAVHNRPAPMMQQPVVYHYQNPTTGEQLASLLPPDHPEMQCLQHGGHLNETKFGILGTDELVLTGRKHLTHDFIQVSWRQ